MSLKYLKQKYNNLPPVPFVAKQDGTFEPLPDQKYETIRNAVHGTIEYVYAFDNVDTLSIYEVVGRRDIYVIVNEEGLYNKQFKANDFICETCVHRGVAPNIVGDVAVIVKDDSDDSYSYDSDDSDDSENNYN